MSFPLSILISWLKKTKRKWDQGYKIETVCTISKRINNENCDLQGKLVSEEKKILDQVKVLPHKTIQASKEDIIFFYCEYASVSNIYIYRCSLLDQAFMI